ncbi:MAG: HYR domain-containing protein [Vicinamibacterales bacterium]|nr:HYR domain-containing protein [Vicinamibacterales bacterium]
MVAAPADFTVEAGGPAGALVTFSASAQDDISGPLAATCAPASGTTFPLGATAVTCSATDGDGNVGTASFTVTVADTTAPVISVPASITGVQATVPGGAPVTYSVTATDLVAPSVTLACAPASGATFPLGTSTVSCTATDAAGNTAAASFTVTVVDTVAPVVGGFSFPPGFTPGQWYGESSVTATINVADASTVTVRCSDSLGETATTVDGLTVTIRGDGIHLVSCTVTDEGGNSTTSEPTAVQLDGTPPTASGPAVQVSAEAISAAGAIVSYEFTGADATSGVSLSCAPPSGSTFPVGTTPVVCTATDGAGNEASVNFTVRVADSTPPVITFPGGTTTLTLDAGTTFVDPGAVASDLVDGAVTVTVAGSVDTTVPGTYTLTYTATDAALNTATLEITVTVVDRVPPVVTVPDGITAEAASAAGAAVSFTATALDAISGAATTTCAPASGSVFALGETTVSCSAQDGSGNPGTATFTVTVRDTTSPVVTPPAPVTAEATSAEGAVVTYGAASATDAVTASPAVVCTPARGTTFPLGVTTVACSATDGAGNTGTASFTVTVRDGTAPVVALLGQAAMTIEAGSAFTDPGATATDLVAGPLPVTVSGAVQTTVPGTYTLTYAATDPSGNRGTATRTVTVRDTVAPAVTVGLNPLKIWSPNGAMVPVTVSGRVTDAGSGVDPSSGVTFAVKDEYGQIQPSGPVTLADDGSYSFTVSLQASRKGSDKNGRTYTVTITATDRAGLQTKISIVETAVEHSQGG